MIADADGANLALFVEFAKSSGCLLDPDARGRPVHLEDIDVVRMKTTERILELLEDTLARAVAFDFAIRPVDTDFGREDNVLPVTVLAEGFAHDLFRTPIAVDGCCVD